MAQAHMLLFLLATIGCLAIVSQARLKDHIVGGSYGWRIPRSKTFYQDWAKTKTFLVGDKLVFLYTSGMQNVIEASNVEDFTHCKLDNVIDMRYKGPTIIKMTKPGTHYFYCSVGLHCEAGQKLKINVSA